MNATAPLPMLSHVVNRFHSEIVTMWSHLLHTDVWQMILFFEDGNFEPSHMEFSGVFCSFLWIDSQRDLGRRMWRTGWRQVSGEWDG